MKRIKALRIAWVCVLVLFAAAGAAAQGGAVAEDAAAGIAKSAAAAAFGDAEVVDIEPYTDTDDAVSAYSVELRLAETKSSVTVIVSARRDDVPVLMLWRGLPKHVDPDGLERVARAVRAERKLSVSAPDHVIWLDLFEAWGVYPEIDPETSEPFIVNLFNGRTADWDELMRKWERRQQRFAEMFRAGLGSESASAKSLKAQGLAGYIASKWAEADEIVTRMTGGGDALLKLAPPTYTRYIEGVPNIDQGANPDCGIVAAMDVALYWDTRGYDRLVDGSDLATVRANLRTAMSYSGGGTTDPNTRDGLDSFVNASAYSNQYSYAVILLDTPNPAFSDLTSEIDSARPVMFGIEDYTNDPNNPHDNEYGDHWVAAVGYFDGLLLPGHSSTRWVIVHDNWGGGTYTNPYLIDNEPYIDWNRATDCIIQIRPQPAGTAVTYPSASGITWTAGQAQLVTWRGFDGATVTLELYKGSTLIRTIASGVANTLQGGSYNYTLPTDLENGTDYRVRVSIGGQSDYSDNLISIFASSYLSVTNPSASGISWSAGGIYNITWSSVGSVGASVIIELYKGGSLNATISALTANDGSYSWEVPAVQTPGSDYRIKILSASNASIYDYSDNYFSITAAPVIQVTYPSAAGISWSAGGSYTITWSSSGNPGTYVSILLYKGDVPWSYITNSVANVGSYTWMVPANQAAGADYRIMVQSNSNSAVKDLSDNFFAIINPTPATLTVTYPTVAGISWAAGLSYTISWSSSGTPGDFVEIDLYKGAALHTVIAGMTANDGSHTWTVPANQAAGADYRIKVSSTANSSLNDYSDSYVSIIVPPSSTLSVTYPSAAGISLNAGSAYTLAWNSTGSIGALVRIELLKNESLYDTLSSSTENDSAFIWQIPSSMAAGGDYKIRITSVSQTSATDTSDNPFAISLPGGGYPQPNEGTIGTQSLMTSSGLGSAGSIYVGGMKCTPVSWSDSSVRWLIKKPLSPGVYDVTITPKTPKGLPSKVFPSCYTIKAPEVVSLSTGNGSPGQLVTVSGKFFGTKKGKVALQSLYGSPINCKVVSWSMDSTSNAGTVVFAISKKAVGEFGVTVTNGAGAVTSSQRIWVSP